MKQTALALLLLLLPLGVVAPATAQNIANVRLSAQTNDSLAINTNLRQGAEQIRMIEVVLRYQYAPGDTLHASPDETAVGRFTLMSADSVIVVRSREWDITQVPTSILPNAQKILARDFMDAICYAITQRRADLDSSGRCEFN